MKEMSIFGNSKEKTSSEVNEELATRIGNKYKSFNNATRDNEFKSFFSRLDVLSGILRDLIPEFKGYSLEEVRSRLTEDVNRKDHAEILNTEDSFGGSIVKYDILFNVKFKEWDVNNSKGEHEESVLLRLDLEMQRIYNTKYPMMSRSIYYTSRLLGQQSVKGSAYRQLKPVRSIWIFVRGVPEDLRNKVVHVRFDAYDEDENMLDREIFPGLNLINIDYVLLSPETYNGDTDLVRFLLSVFTSQSGEISYNPYEIDTINVKKEVKSMSNIIEDINDCMEIERQKGMEEGIEKGIEKGMDSLLKTFIVSKREQGMKDNDIRKELSLTFSLSDTEIDRLME